MLGDLTSDNFYTSSFTVLSYASTLYVGRRNNCVAMLVCCGQDNVLHLFEGGALIREARVHGKDADILKLRMLFRRHVGMDPIDAAAAWHHERRPMHPSACVVVGSAGASYSLMTPEAHDEMNERLGRLGGELR